MLINTQRIHWQDKSSEDGRRDCMASLKRLVWYKIEESNDKIYMANIFTMHYKI